jgi:hypothetical protein
MTTTPLPTPDPKKRSYDWVAITFVTLFMFALFLGTIFMLGYVYKDRMIASTVNLAVHSFLTETPLPEDQKKAIIYQTDRLYTAFLDKKIKLEDLTTVVEHLLKGPTFPVGALYFSLNDYVDASALSEAQKADAHLQVGRMSRAGMAGKFTAPDLQPIVDLIKTPPLDPKQTPPKDKTLIKPTLSPEELQQAIALTRKLADDAQEPNEPYTFDPSQHIRKAVDQVLGPENALMPLQ